MKSKILKIIAATTLLTAFTAALKAPVSGADLGFVNANNVNIRVEPSTDSQILGKFYESDAINVVSLEGEWYKIEIQPSDFYYISSQYVTIVSAEAIVSSEGVSFMKNPGADELYKLSVGTEVNATAVVGDFFAVVHDGEEGYVHKDYLIGQNIANLPTFSEDENEEPVAETETVLYAVVESSNGLRLRKSASTESDILAVLPSKASAEIIEKGDEWHKVVYNGQIGFVFGEFVSIHTAYKDNNTNNSGDIGNEIAEFALRYLGTPYKWGGTNLNSGVDCSGFVYSVMKNFGITLNRTSRDQIKNGTVIAKSELEPGDLVFFDTSGTNRGNISHVGIYIGNGEFVHASSNKKYCVIVSNLNEAYYTRNYVSACRIVN